MAAKAIRLPNSHRRWRSWRLRAWSRPPPDRKREVNHFWTLDDDEQLRMLARNGLSLAEPALEMERAASSVRTRALKLNVGMARDSNGMQKAKATRTPVKLS